MNAVSKSLRHFVKRQTVILPARNVSIHKSHFPLTDRAKANDGSALSTSLKPATNPLEIPQMQPRHNQSSAPKYLLVGCSDHLVNFNEILGLRDDESFTYRNFGNLIQSSNDLNALSALEYAVDELGVEEIVVFGHYGCHAVKTAIHGSRLPTLENWLQSIRDVYDQNRGYLALHQSNEEKYRSLVELNIRKQCVNIFRTGIVQRKRAQINKELLANCATKEEIAEQIFPRVHGFVFDNETGTITKLPIDLQNELYVLVASFYLI